jgi:hypothetical protein
LQNAGFKVRSVEMRQKEEVYSSVKLFSDAISHWLPHLKQLPFHLRAEFIQDLVAAYIQEYPVDDKGQVHFYVDNLIAQAYKN